MPHVAFQLEAIRLERSSSNDSSLKEKPPKFHEVKIVRNAMAVAG